MLMYWAWAVAIAYTLCELFLSRTQGLKKWSRKAQDCWGWAGLTIYALTIVITVFELGGCESRGCPPGTMEVMVNRVGDYRCM